MRMASWGYHFIVISINQLRMARQTDERPEPLSIAFRSSLCKSLIAQYGMCVKLLTGARRTSFDSKTAAL